MSTDALTHDEEVEFIDSISDILQTLHAHEQPPPVPFPVSATENFFLRQIKCDYNTKLARIAAMNSEERANLARDRAFVETAVTRTTANTH
jgi:hypothetical protein